MKQKRENAANISPSVEPKLPIRKSHLTNGNELIKLFINLIKFDNVNL